MTTARNYLTAHSTGSHREIGATSSPGRFSLALEKRPGDEVGIGGGIQIPERLLQSLLTFLTPPPESPGGLALGLLLSLWKSLLLQFLIIFTLLCLIPLNNKFKLTLVSHSRFNFKVVIWIINI